MDDPSAPAPSAAERELRELRMRAYGPHADIEDDPVALARLAELESAHAMAAHATPSGPSPATPAIGSAAPPDQTPAPEDQADAATVSVSGGDSAQPLWRRATTTRRGRMWLIGGAVVVVIGLVYAVTRLVGMHPETTLRPTDAEPDLLVYRMMRFADELQMVDSTVRPFGSYRGIETWAAEDAFGNPCFLAFDRPRQLLLGAECTPPEGDLITDVGAWPLWDTDLGPDLPPGSVIRFHYSGDTVEVYHFPAAG